MTGCNRIINWKECGSKGSCLNLKHHPTSTYETNLTCTGHSNNICTKFPATRFSLQACHQQRVFIIIKVVLSKWSKVCSSVAYNGPFQKHYFKYYKDSLMMATMECRNL